MSRSRRALVAIALWLAGATVAHALDKVRIGVIGGASDVGFYLADAKGWFREAGIEVDMTRFDSGARMIAPMSNGDLDVGTGVVTAGLYNAFDRAITIRIVADKGRNVKGMSFQGFAVRKALFDSGEVRDFGGLKGRKIAFTGPGANDASVVDDGLRKFGLSLKDVEIVYLGLPSQLVAYSNGAIDASILPEPFRTAAIRKDLVRELLPIAELRDNDQSGTVTYSDHFIRDRRDVAQRLMTAYLRGVRYYVDSLAGGRIAGPHADEVVDVISRYSSVKDKDIIRAIVPTAIDPDGRFSAESLQRDLAFYKANGQVKPDVDFSKVADTSFIETSVAELGPYRPKP